MYSTSYTTRKTDIIDRDDDDVDLGTNRRITRDIPITTTSTRTRFGRLRGDDAIEADDVGGGTGGGMERGQMIGFCCLGVFTFILAIAIIILYILVFSNPYFTMYYTMGRYGMGGMGMMGGMMNPYMMGK